MPCEYTPIVLLVLGEAFLAIGALAGPETPDVDFRSAEVQQKT